ncbi:MAG TPA: PAS domain S-box protein [Aggregatilinea sp.]|uniref:PAS domain S-box protein n=1 Tax=Aggregatilinea sp. TaxID=2806333 RepID=UPI002BAD6903|nr:PAS domain S-box protein [Aggregatilinea sp.]HML24757.1 PAS domain S-box protein [Aggregatilinea sp.]
MMKILYVEDNPFDVDLTRRELSRTMPGIHIDSAATLKDARAILSNIVPYELLMIDLSLPDGSGLDLLREARQQKLPLAIVILTGSGDEQAAVSALKAGADDYLPKRKGYLQQLPQAIDSALRSFHAEIARKSQPIKVLYVEDDPLDVDLTRRHLDRYAPHISLDTTPQPADVLALLDAVSPGVFPYDLLLLDYRLANLNALDLLKKIRQDARLSIPVVLVTGHGNENIATQALRMGATDYLVKHESYLFQLPAVLESAYRQGQLEHEQAALKESEARYRRFAENAPDIIYRYQLLPKPAFSYINPAVTAITGYSPDDYYADPALGSRLFRVLNAAHDFNRLSDEELKQPFVFRTAHKSGTPLWLEVRHVPLRNEAGKLLAVEGIARDVTEREKAEAKLRQSEETFRLLFASNPHPMWVYDLETLQFLEVNEAAINHYGYSHDEFMALRLVDIRPPEDVERLLEDVQRRRTVLQQSGEWRHKLKNGRVIDVEITSHTLEFAGRPAALVIAQDITERKQVQRAEQEQRALAEALRDTAAALSSAVDLETVMVGVLENAARVVPHDAANIMLIKGGLASPTYWRGYAPELDALLREFSIPLAETTNLQEMFVTGKPFLAPYAQDYPGWIRQPLTAWVKSHLAIPIRSHGLVLGFLNLDSATPGFFTEGHVGRLQVFADQISVAIERAQLYEEIRSHAAVLEQHVAERTAALQNSEARYRAIVEDQTDMVCRYLPDTTITFANQAFCALLNRPLDEVLGMPWMPLVPDSERLHLERHVASLTQDSPIGSTETLLSRPDGETLWVHWTTRILLDEAGAFIEYQTVGHDITQRKQIEQRLRQTLEHEMELNEMKSRFVSMASHEFRTPLAVIQSAADLLRRYGDRMSEDETGESFSRITSSIKNMIELLDDVLMVTMTESGKLEFKPEIINLKTFCQNQLAEYKQTIGSQHHLNCTISGDCLEVAGDRKLMRHIIGNLLSNAIKYSPAGSNVTLNVDCSEPEIIIRIKDEGIGIPRADQARLFEVFHRASNVGVTPGTGLGLAIVKQSVTLCGGSIAFESEVGRGTTFTVVLPLLKLEGTLP